MRLLSFLIVALPVFFVSTLNAAFLNPQAFTLKNGMRVIVIENHRAPVVYHSVWYRVGSADEDPSKPRGLAHFCEHMMFKGTKQNPKDAFTQALQKIGGHHNAFTSFDLTAYYQLAGVEHLEALMALESDRMLNLQVTLDDVATELNVVAEERRMRCENQHEAQLWEKSLACFFAHHPYGTPYIGWLHDIQSYTPEIVRAFYKKWYQPSNATLIVAGDITCDHVKALAEQYFGTLPSAPPCRRVRLKEPPSHRTSVELIRVSDQTQLSQLTFYWDVPTINTRESLKAAAAIEVLCKIVGVGRTSRLYKSLVEDQKLVSHVSMNYTNLRDHGLCTLSLAPHVGVPLHEARHALEQELCNLKTKPITTEELKSAKERVLGGLDYVRDSIETAAYIVGCFITSDIEITTLEAWPQALAEVTSQDIQEAVTLLLEQPRFASTLQPEGQSVACAPSMKKAPLKKGMPS